MKISEKLERAKSEIRFLAQHDDAPVDDVVIALDELTEFIQEERQAAVQRSKAREAASAEEAE